VKPGDLVFSKTSGVVMWKDVPHVGYVENDLGLVKKGAVGLILDPTEHVHPQIARGYLLCLFDTRFGYVWSGSLETIQ
jgi:hypothetical protein